MRLSLLRFVFDMHILYQMRLSPRLRSTWAIILTIASRFVWSIARAHENNFKCPSASSSCIKSKTWKYTGMISYNSEGKKIRRHGLPTRLGMRPSMCGTVDAFAWACWICHLVASTWSEDLAHTVESRYPDLLLSRLGLHLVDGGAKIWSWNGTDKELDVKSLTFTYFIYPDMPFAVLICIGKQMEWILPKQQNYRQSSWRLLGRMDIMISAKSICVSHIVLEETPCIYWLEILK